MKKCKNNLHNKIEPGLCKLCYTANTKRQIKIRQENPDRRKSYMKAWRQKNKDKVLSTKKSWYQNNKDKVYAMQRKSTYGISINEYERLKTKQNNQCAICLNTSEKSNLVIDHDHSTGKVRGLLCSSCNKGIGFLKDDSVLLQKAVRYLTC